MSRAKISISKRTITNAVHASQLFSAEQIVTLRRAMNATWQQIGHDCEQFVEDNEGAVEACIDADRLVFNCGWGDGGKADGAAADAIVRETIKRTSYAATLRALSALVSFK
jgi:hypothetical protein